MTCEYPWSEVQQWLPIILQVDLLQKGPNAGILPFIRASIDVTALYASVQCWCRSARRLFFMYSSCPNRIRVYGSYSRCSFRVEFLSASMGHSGQIQGGRNRRLGWCLLSG